MLIFYFIFKRTGYNVLNMHTKNHSKILKFKDIQTNLILLGIETARKKIL